MFWQPRVTTSMTLGRRDAERLDCRVLVHDIERANKKTGCIRHVVGRAGRLGEEEVRSSFFPAPQKKMQPFRASYALLVKAEKAKTDSRKRRRDGKGQRDEAGLVLKKGWEVARECCRSLGFSC